MKKIVAPILFLILVLGFWWLKNEDPTPITQSQTQATPDTPSQKKPFTRSISKRDLLRTPDQQTALEISGKVFDLASKEPIEGASVWFADREQELSFTESNGVYSLKFEESLIDGSIIATAPDYEPQKIPFQIGRGIIHGPSFGLRLIDASIRGKVSSSEKPLENVVISLDLRRSGQLLQTATDSNGFFQLDMPSDAAFTLRVEKEGWHRMTRLDTNRLEPGELRQYDIVMAPKPNLTGRLVSPTGAPLADLDVALNIFKRRKPPIRIKSNSDGRFLFTSVTPNRYQLRASGKDFAGAIGNVQVTGEWPVIDLGDIPLQTSISLEGLVLDVSGRGVPEAQVWRLEDLSATPTLEFTRQPPEWPSDIKTDAEGGFVLNHLIPGEVFIIEVRHPHHLPAWRKHTAGDVPLEIHLKQAGEITGQIVNEEGQPLSPGHIHLDWKRRQIRSSWEYAKAQSDGSFRISGLPLGGHRLRAISPGYAITVSPDIVLSSDQPDRFITLVMEPEMILEGWVSDSKGDPLPDVSVYPAVNGRISAKTTYGNVEDPLVGVMTTSDVAGFYRLTNLPAKEQPYRAEKKGYKSLTKTPDYQPGVRQMDFLLETDRPPVFRVSGKVQDPGGRAIQGVDIGLVLNNSSRYWTASDDQGAFLFEEVEEGRYNFYINKSGWYSPSELKPLEVRDHIENLGLILNPTHVISGMLNGLDPQHARAVEIKAYKNVRSFSKGHADPMGQYEIEGITPGEWVVTASVEQTGDYAKETVFVPADSPIVKLDLDLRRGFTFSTTAVQVHHQGTQTPAAGFRIMFNSEFSPKNFSGLLDENGQIKFTGISPGNYTLLLMNGFRGVWHNEVVRIDQDLHKNIQMTIGSMAGQVVDIENGNPIEDVLVSLVGRRIGDHHTDSQGNFFIDGLPMGTQRITLVKNGYTHLPINFALDDSEPSIQVVLEMTPERHLDLDFSMDGHIFTNRVSLRLFDASGKPVIQNIQLTGEPDQKGRIRIDSVPAGDFLVFAQSGRDLFALASEVNPDNGPVIMTMREGGRLRFIVPGIEDRFKTIELISVQGWPIPFTSLVSNEELFLPNTPTGNWSWRIEYNGRQYQGQTTIKSGVENKIRIQPQ